MSLTYVNAVLAGRHEVEVDCPDCHSVNQVQVHAERSTQWLGPITMVGISFDPEARCDYCATPIDPELIEEAIREQLEDPELAG